MTGKQILPTIMLVLSVGASVVYGLTGDWRHAMYWGAVSFVTFSVTF